MQQFRRALPLLTAFLAMGAYPIGPSNAQSSGIDPCRSEIRIERIDVSKPLQVAPIKPETPNAFLPRTTLIPIETDIVMGERGLSAYSGIVAVDTSLQRTAADAAALLPVECLGDIMSKAE